MDFAHHDNSEEQNRLNDLDSFEIIDTPQELSFDQFTCLASEICETPIALLSFISAERQWFKSTVGLDIKEIPKHLSPCLKTVQQDKFLEVQNMIEDPFFASNHFTIHSHFRFYAGVPLVSPQHYNIGTLCVIDYVPRKLTELQRKTLKIIADQIMVQVELRQAYLKTLKELRDMGRSKYHLEHKYREIVHRSRMKALAELAAGIGFQFHDPVNLIRVSSLHLKARHEREKGDEYKAIDQGVRKIERVLKSLESFVDIEKDRSKGPIDYYALVNEAIQEVMGIIRNKNIELRKNIQHSIMAVGNHDQLLQAINGVLMNAIEAVSEEEKPSIEVSLKTETGLIIFLVMDSGDGVDRQIEDYIFEPYYSTKGHDQIGRAHV